ncbi:hypothetical protein C7W88_09445 [Novosphingobium sp. THN1]|uniref:hypothetical protein n=1 Tax=Novosphingobium sp. THN1 TaxID=1016987 RepID=UPI000E492AB3|nr:hypothetical protein [Novosphingobium sp. THN1]AXU19209.1 hypothetical protein C7W88_09445 [Novosphingobium sp. THN1]
MNNEIGKLDQAWLELQAIEQELTESLAVLDAIRSKCLVGFEAYLTSREIRNRWEESRLRWQALADAAMRLL